MIRSLRTELAAAIGFLTRLPVGWLMPRDPQVDMAQAIWAFPLAGAAIGLFGGGVFTAAIWVGMPASLCACWSLTATLLLTGALHEDGLADMTDGFGGGRDAVRKLAIMRDSRIGSFGALSLLLSILVRLAALVALASPGRVLAALVVSGALSRAAILVVLVSLPPARMDGLASGMRAASRKAAGVGLALAVALTAWILHGWITIEVSVFAFLAALIVIRLARRQVGGHTGDVLGACAVMTECVVLTCLCAR